MLIGNSLAWVNSEWRALDQLALPLDDIGFLQGVVIVDRLRTFQHKSLDVGLHLERWRNSCEAVGIVLPQLAFDAVIEQLVERNRGYDDHADYSIVLLATPGRSGSSLRTPTMLAHLAPIPWKNLARWYAVGQSLRTTSHQGVPTACWSPAIKTRARLNYYLSDQQAQLEAGEESAAGLLLAPTKNNELSLTETSAANLLIVERSAGGAVQLFSPPEELILGGISLRRTLRLARQLGYPIRYEPISIARAVAADEVLLTGTTGCLWPAAELNSRQFIAAAEQPVYQALAQAWKQDILCDYTQLPTGRT